MTHKSHFAVREIQKKDIPLVVKYWNDSTDAHLIGMGVDPKKNPSTEFFYALLLQQLDLSNDQKSSYTVIWEVDGLQVGHSNVNQINYGEVAIMHLHLWNSTIRQKGLGTEFVKKSLSFFFKNLRLKKLICQPYALNPAPNKTLEKVGFKFIKRYKTIPGSINFEQEVNLWEMTKKNLLEI